MTSSGPPSDPRWPAYPAYPPPPPARSGVPAWVWPLLVATGTIFGLVGGLLGGALVLGTRGTTGAGLPSAGRPLGADNASVAAVAAKVLPSTVQVRVAAAGDEPVAGAPAGSTGSGFVVDDDGHVITNNHVVDDAQGGRITVVDVDGGSHPARVVGRSPVYDLAVLRVEGAEHLEPAALGASRSMHVGDTVVAVGSPLGLSSTVTAGIVSAVERPVTTGSGEEGSYINAVQTDAAINPGNSGGPLVDLRGRVVGVNSAIATTGVVLGGSAGNIGVGFAIPVEQVRFTAAQIVESGEAEYPVIGAHVRTAGPGDGAVDGAVLATVPEGTPAARAGLEVGDRVVAVDGRRVGDGIGLIVAIRSHRPGDTIELTVVRDGDRRSVAVRLDAKVG